MQRERRVEVAELVENLAVGRFQVFVLVCCFLILFVDGLDYNAANVGASGVMRAFHADKSAMGWVFGWGNFGILCGSFLFGYIGDRFGRKSGALGGVLFYSVPALLVFFASSLGSLMVLRFFAGLGIGGVIPNTIALLTEIAPKKYRGSFVMLGLVAYSLGTAAIGQVAAWFAPVFGWWFVFVTAGAVGSLLGLLLAFILPESVRYLALTKPDSPRLRSYVQRLAPDLAVTPDTRFYLHHQAQPGKFSWRRLFMGDQWLATPLLGLAFCAESLTFMTFISWLAVILEAKGLAPRQAALAFSFAAVGGVCGLLIMSRFVDRYGPMATVVTALCSIALVAALGMNNVSPAAIIVTAVFAMAFLASTHNSLNATVGAFYPTNIRSNGVGYATGMGRIGLVAGPVVAGYLMAAHLPMRPLLYLIAAPYLVVAVVCVSLGYLYQTRFSHGEAAGPAAAATDTVVLEEMPRPAASG